MKIIKYSKEYKTQWNNFLSNTKNYHFFFNREYMEYHEDRFKDFSLIIFDDKNRILSLFPANVTDSTIFPSRTYLWRFFI